METNPLVSVCVPIYNAANFLSECVQSVIDQTYSNLEILLIDNGSNDGSLQIARSFMDHRIQIHVETNRGAAKARNRGLKIAKGKYIQFLDADDLLSSDKIQKQVKSLEIQPGKVAVCSTIHFFDDDNLNQLLPSPYEEQFLYSTNDPVEFIINLWGGNNFKASMVQPNAWLTPMDIISKSGYWNELLTLDDDGEFFARVILNSSGLVKTGGFNYYRKHKTTLVNLSAQKNTISLTSAYNAILLKRDILFSWNNSEKAQKTIYKQLKELSVRCFLYQPKLYEEINKELKNYDNYKYIPVFGSKTINLLAKFAGWKFAKRSQRIYHKIKKILTFIIYRPYAS